MKGTFEEGTELIVDTETINLSAGWSESPANSCALFRIGQMVTLVLRLAYAAKTPAQIIAALPADFRPAMGVRDYSQQIEILANGEVIQTTAQTGREAAGGGLTYETSWRAAAISP